MKEYYKQLNKMLDQILASWGLRSIAALAEEAELHVNTVHMINYRVTKYPRFLTVWKLAKATGYTMELRSLRAKMKVA